MNRKLQKISVHFDDFAAAQVLTSPWRGVGLHSVAGRRQGRLTPDLLPWGVIRCGESTGDVGFRRSLTVCQGHASVHTRAYAKTRAFALSIRGTQVEARWIYDS